MGNFCSGVFRAQRCMYNQKQARELILVLHSTSFIWDANDYVSDGEGKNGLVTVTTDKP